jgi:hypothetical protein
MRPSIADGEWKPAVPRGGWLSPDGRYWPCSDQEHQETAEAIIRELKLHSGRDAETVLEEAGWLHIQDNGLLFSWTGYVRSSGDFTQSQLDAIFDLASAHPSMRERLMAALEEQRRISEIDGIPR